ncbi:MAG: prepilin-type N-terminal cleavage/methylation domain-containing protein [Nitrospirota bacterium]
MDTDVGKASAMHAAGFSLIEAMMALFILSVGCLGVIGMVSLADRAMASSAKLDRASALAREVLEKNRSASFEEFVLENGRGDRTESIGPFARERRFQRDRPSAGLATLSVEIRWRDGQGRPRKLDWAMLRADPRAGDP